MESRGWWGPPKRCLVPCLLSSRHAVRCFLGLTDIPFHFAFAGQKLSALCHLGGKKNTIKKSSKHVCQSARSISDWECSILMLYFALLQCKNFILERVPFNSKFQINVIYHFALVEIILCFIIFGINLSPTLQKFHKMS